MKTNKTITVQEMIDALNKLQDKDMEIWWWVDETGWTGPEKSIPISIKNVCFGKQFDHDKKDEWFIDDNCPLEETVIKETKKVLILTTMWNDEV